MAISSFALVTGASARIGKALALSLADIGYNILLHYRSSREKAERTRQQIEETGRTCILKQADFSDEESVRSLWASCIAEGNIEVLVNNASLFVESDIQTAGTKLLDRLFKTNFKAPYILTKQFGRSVQQGVIINLLDTKVNHPQTGHLDYLLTKKMLEAFTEISADQLAPDIRVNGIAPGLILPPDDKTEDYLQQKATAIPMEKTGSVQQLVHAMRFFINNEFVTGEVINVDGGEHL